MQVSTTTEIQFAIDAILKVLGQPENTLNWQHHAMEQFNRGEPGVEITAASNLNDYYCRCLGFLFSAKTQTPQLASFLMAAAKAAAKYAEQKTLDELSDRLAAAFESSDPSGEGTQAIIDVLIPFNELQQKALDHFHAKDYHLIRSFSKSEKSWYSFYETLLNLADLSSSSPSLPMVLSEAACSAAKYVRLKTQDSLEKQIAISFL